MLQYQIFCKLQAECVCIGGGGIIEQSSTIILSNTLIRKKWLKDNL